MMIIDDDDDDDDDDDYDYNINRYAINCVNAYILFKISTMWIYFCFGIRITLIKSLFWKYRNVLLHVSIIQIQLLNVQEMAVMCI